ncbi:hypothetical protein METBIDRAFT_137696 [Metschnikowia bicuspidata var. bicuspidata NRRL YB-4993]|uniref:Uncharacterized protein n=1 Tax=Metschnikowia bicuspidata var. bicuspidata NRRL YB-4993 TaxID=869754 RepID=A0A1A0GWK1_9ASCO|nr:hypothetical protein METBIDRAFT_137696 [Metschnikowia bicuspidata var. bicuspidata NRRL YB-4993]OBA16121.1 hypothetical protein METBIDRAFT_137696 [Metschnikowia bicuspidata var. bicuspidata NRRL YB-4993]
MYPLSSGASDASSLSPASSMYPPSSGASKPSSLSSSSVHSSSSASLGPKYTTTYTTTETDHSIVTKTIVVCVTTDATGCVTTVTSTVLHCPTTDCEPTELPNPTITGETPVPTASCNEGGSCTPAVETTSNIAPVPSGAAKVSYTTETLIITTTISKGPASYATSTLTVTRTVSIDCDTCETGEGSNPTVAPATDAPGHVLGSTTSSGTMTATLISSISPFEGGAGSRSVVLGMFVLSLLAFLL